jgi:hypothetical protein
MRLATLALSATILAACSSGRLGDGRTDPGVSPGTVTVRLTLPSTESFCDTIDGCSGVAHVFFGKEPGNWLTVGAGGYCPLQCSSQCIQPPCRVAGGACPPIAAGVLVTNVEGTWDGSYVEWSTCGSGTACYNPHFVPPGRYYARLCATPGTLTDTVCTATAAQECVDLPFDLPGPSPIEVPLPSADGG